MWVTEMKMKVLCHGIFWHYSGKKHELFDENGRYFTLYWIEPV